MMILPLSSYRFARGATKLQTMPLHEYVWTPTACPTRNGLFPAGTAIALGTEGFAGSLFSILVPAGETASHSAPKASSPSPFVWPFLVSLTNVYKGWRL